MFDSIGGALYLGEDPMHEAEFCEGKKNMFNTANSLGSMTPEYILEYEIFGIFPTRPPHVLNHVVSLEYQHTTKSAIKN